jgi:hypothetical protein
MTLAEMYSKLELSIPAGKQLTKDIKEYTRSSPFVSLLDKNCGVTQTNLRVRLAKYAFHLLKIKDWGLKWFGFDIAKSEGRKKYWPADSLM